MTARKSTGKAARKSTSVRRTARIPERGSENSNIAVAAYFKAQARGFAPGHELEDWLAAEAEAKSWALH